MGNIVDKTITKSDICYDFFVKELINKHDYMLVKLDNIRACIDKNLDSQVLFYKGMYIFKLDKIKRRTNPGLYSLQRDMILPFIEQICIQDFIDLDHSLGSVRNDDELYICAFSHGNFCKCIAILSLSFVKPDILHQKVNPNLKLVPVINVLCALTFRRNEKVNDIFLREKMGKIKVRFGQLLFYFALKSLIKKNVPFVQLESHINLLPYYLDKLKFKLGPCPEFEFTSLLRKPMNTDRRLMYEDKFYERAFIYAHNHLYSLVEKHFPMYKTEVERTAFLSQIEEPYTIIPIDFTNNHLKSDSTFILHLSDLSISISDLKHIIINEFKTDEIEAKMFFANDHSIPYFIEGLVSARNINKSEQELFKIIDNHSTLS